MLRKDRLAVVFAAMLAIGAGGALLLRGQQPGVSRQPQAALAAYQQAVALFDAKQYPQARAQVDEALRLDPELPDARLLKNVIDMQLAALTAPAPPGSATASAPATAPVDPLLTQEQVNRIRMFEMTDAEVKSAAGTIDPRDLDDFWTNVMAKNPARKARSAQDFARFAAPENLAAQLAAIREEHATAFYDKAHLTTEPAIIRTFRSRVQPYILQNCASCHAGAGAVVFRLYGVGSPPNEVPDRETYTNFLVLSIVAAGDHGLVNRADPERSLIVQYALPRKDAALLHPLVNGKEAELEHVAGPADSRYLDMLDWAKSLAYPGPDYGIDFKILAKKAFVPATRPGH